MIIPIYGVNCLKLGFERYKRYCKLPIEINVSRSSISFYISKDNNSEKIANTRISNHHAKLQRYTDNGREPWLYDNISIEFIIPNSDEDKKAVRGRVYQNRLGTIQPFDVTIYQYNSDLIEPSDIVAIFKAIIVFLDGNGYTDPFEGTFKKAKVIPRHSNIKPYNRRSTDIQSECLVHKRHLSMQRLNEISSYCLQGLIAKNNNTKSQYSMKQIVRLTEGDLHRIIRKCVNEALNEVGNTEKGQWLLGAVRGRAAARPRYHNHPYNSVNGRRKQDRINNMANDEAWANKRDYRGEELRKMDDAHNQGYLYGYTKGIEG